MEGVGAELGQSRFALLATSQVDDLKNVGQGEPRVRIQLLQTHHVLLDKTKNWGMSGRELMCRQFQKSHDFCSEFWVSEDSLGCQPLQH